MKKSFLYLTTVLFFWALDAFASNPVIVPPDNDLIADAIDLNSGPFPYSELAVNFPEATVTNDATDDPSCSIVQAGIWYKFTANNTGSVAALIVSPQVPYVVFFTAPDENVTDGSELTFLEVPGNTCALGASTIIETEAGITYYIYMKNTIVSDVLINIAPAMVPPNDFIENAQNLNGMEQLTDEDIVFNLATFTNDGGQNGCDTDETKAVWYKFTAPINGQVVAGIDAPPGEGGVIFYSAADENATMGSDLTIVQQPTNTCDVDNLQSIIATAGTTYYVFAALINAASVNTATVSINLSEILGMEENTIEGLVFYPNPVENEINLSAKTNIDKISIYNLMGQKVYGQQINATKKEIDISNLQHGMYVMQINAQGNTATYKIIKQ